MLNSDQYIPCPICKTNIPFDTRQLMMGIQFGCPNCQASVGLAPESKEVVQQTMHKFDEIKSKAARR